jgi:hypothetical protein
MQLAKGLLSKAKEVAAQTAQELQQRAQESLQKTWEQQQQRKASNGNSGSPPGPVNVPLAPAVQSVEVRAGRFRQELLASCINLQSIRRLAFDGVPDIDNLRTIVWKVNVCAIHGPALRHQPSVGHVAHSGWCGLVGYEGPKQAAPHACKVA